MIDRRQFLRLSGVAGTAALAAACGWDGGGTVKPGLLSLSRLNDWVGEHLLYSPSHLAHTYDASQRSAGLPSYFISNTVPILKDPTAWRLSVGGLVRTPLSLSLDDIQRMPSVTYTVKHHCVEGWSAIATWTGVPVSAIAQRCGMTPAAR